MKKIILTSIAVVAIIATAAFNMNLNLQSNKLSDISLSNVAVLAYGEDYNTKDGNGMYNCEVGSPNAFGESVRWCGSCDGTRIFITGTGKCKKTQ